jgi:hypothetical protein
MIFAIGRAAAALVIGVTVAGVAGCSLSSGTTPSTSTASTPAGAVSPPASATGTAQAEQGTPASVSGGATDAQAIKTVTFVTPDGLDRPNGYRLELTALHRRGPFAVLEGRVACTKGPRDSCDGETVFSADSASYNTPAGILLIDPVGKKEYLPVRDSDNRPYTSKLNPSLPVGTVFPFYINYPAPPADVASVTVVLPGGGQPQITDVPLS